MSAAPRRKRTSRAARPVTAPAARERRQAADHQRTREAHLTELAEDYVEVIAALIAECGEARVVDIARRLGVTHVTVSRTIRRLAATGMVESRPYRAVFLTPAGRELATRSAHRHATVVGFLKALGVPDEAAHSDAEGIEHHVSGETLAAFERFLRRRARQPAAAAGRKPAPRGRARDAEFVIETRRRIL